MGIIQTLGDHSVDSNTHNIANDLFFAKKLECQTKLN